VGVEGFNKRRRREEEEASSWRLRPRSGRVTFRESERTQQLQACVRIGSSSPGLAVSACARGHRKAAEQEPSGRMLRAAAGEMGSARSADA
jgi:hypothetical protein